MSEQVETILSVGTALLLALLIAVSWQAREEIAATVKYLFNRYFVFRWHGVEADHNILSSYEKEEEKTPDTVPVPVLVSPDPVPAAPLSERDIIKWLALAKIEESAYRFSANKIYELVGGRRNEVLKAIAEARTEAPPEPAPERTIVVRDNGAPPREMVL